MANSNTLSIYISLFTFALIGFGCSSADFPVTVEDTGKDSGSAEVSDTGIDSGSDTGSETCVPKKCGTESCGEMEDGCGGKSVCSFVCTLPESCGGSPDYNKNAYDIGLFYEKDLLP